MSTAAALTLAGRKWHESMMDDTCTITRASANGAVIPSNGQPPIDGLEPASGLLDETTGLYPVNPVTIYAGPCRVVVQPRPPKDTNAIGQVEAVTNARLDLPVVASANVRDGDVVVFNTSVDPGLVGARYRLRGLAGQTHGTARRFFVEAYT
ncbi:DUF6093 family protein [Arthrobacter sp. 2RAF6]|uniref:DUF6093 family protein n=1 Tax=Arthrobacter sp. 2RAF6 TaxID=3233002 RepID=UPI003F914D6F